jgi:CheY-like chemotaxis protein
MGVEGLSSTGPESARVTSRDALQKPIDGHALLAALAGAGVFPGSRKLVLVVDRDHEACKQVVGLLARLGCRSLCLGDASHALSVASTLRPAMVLLDLDTPGAAQLAAELAGRDDARPLPLIGCAASAASTERRVA